jgi:ABC-type Na+ efflux pump permease subunit
MLDERMVLTPLFIVGMIYFFGKVEAKGKSMARPPRMVVVDEPSRKIKPQLQEALEQYNKANPQRPLEFREYQGPASSGGMPEPVKVDVVNRRIDGFLHIPDDVVEGTGQVRFYTSTRNASDLELPGLLQSLVTSAVRQRRFLDNQVSAELVDRLSRAVPFERIEAGADKDSAGTQGSAMAMLPFFFMFLMTMGFFGMSQGLLTTLIEEKNSRVMEVLLSSVSPFELMTGKILGLAGVGLTLVGIWAAASFAAASYYGIGRLITPGYVGYFLVYYMLGFLVISSFYAAIGSACNTLKEAQNLIGPLTVIVMVPMVAWVQISQEPNGTMATVLSFIPPVAPMVMILRVVAAPDLPRLQIVLSLLWLALSAVGFMWAGGKIFRTGVLMYGKPPSLREMIRWVGYR